MKKGRHCEERSDAAIHAVQSHGSPRPDGLATTEGCGVAMTEGCGLAGKKGRHCEERSDAAIHAVRSPGLSRNACNDGLRSHGSPRPNGLAMTEGCGVAMTEGCGLAGMKGRHCEERSDVAIHAVQSHGLPRFARNDGFQSHGSPRPDGLAMTEGCGLAGKKGRHCEERSDAAIHAVQIHGLPRFACNDGFRSHGLPRNACNDGLRCLGAVYA